ncbi:sodium:proton antiporter [Phormidium sp. CLA17]|uniref:cation:proton antiporter n=1 Tax=Leptolyngbya sp. Cla-17 TaxID=2803751 RepID=UPI00149298EA|nr:sodium:proton antiporter [Leptolyngbya sp. Cla-17]MBM0742354.1 sodium:proton antiporter [Leptolyngbya sp. Cla-17]
MDIYILKLLVIGLLLLFVTLGSGLISRLPLSYALIYLLVGIFLSPYGLNLIQLRPEAEFLERLTEFVVLISLFSCGLKMNRPLQTWAWNSTIRLIGLLMPLTIFAVAAIAHFCLGFDWGVAILLGAILAPTDPVLASEVQISHPDDKDELRFGLTSEGGLNDALAFPFVYFGLHWLKDDNWQNWITQWIAVDVIWAIAVGLVMGIIVARTVVWLDKQAQQFITIDSLMEDFVALGMILLTYSLTEVVNGYGFLAVFVAGVVAQKTYHDPEKRFSQLEFSETLEKLLEIATILLLGSLLRIEPILRFLPQGLLIAGALIFLIRPLGAWISTTGENYSPMRRLLFGWFGIRGVGSLYYLAYALGSGLKGEVGEQIAWITFITVIVSVLIHGISSTPLMNRYERHIERRKKRALEAKSEAA